jgi:hypothetical protein
MEVRPYLVHGQCVRNNFPLQFLLHITHDKIIALEVRSENIFIFRPQKAVKYNGFTPNTE